MAKPCAKKTKACNISWLGVLCERSQRLVLVLLLAVIPDGLVSAASPDCEVAEQALQIAVSIRGLQPKREIPCSVQDQTQVRDYILKALSSKISPERFKHEELLFKALGFLPEDFAYKEGIIKLYVSQIGGYYDPEKGHFAMASWIPAAMQTSIAVHELTHALQDQYFDLKHFIDEKFFASDALLARAALVEGDATAVMMDYARGLAGRGGIAEEESVRSLLLQNVIGMSLVSSVSEVPQSLQLILLFPYTSGLRFAHKLLREDGYQRIDKAFRKPPRSTEEVLHPHKYGLEQPDFIVITPESIDKELVVEGARRLHYDTLGEFITATLLAEISGDKADSSKAAAGWGGDTAVLYELANGDHLTVWKTHWDSESDAQEFQELLKKGLFGDTQAVGSDGWTPIPGRREWRDARIVPQGLYVTVSLLRRRTDP